MTNTTDTHGFDITFIPTEQIHPAAWNANRVDPATLKKIRHSIQTFNIVENNIVRPCRCDQLWETHYETISGNHRLQLYHDLHITTIPCIIRDLDDGMARILADLLNRTRGKNDRAAYEELIRQAAALTSQDTITSLLLETDKSLQTILTDQARHDPPAHWQNLHQVIIDCASPEQQEQLYNELNARGLTCKILTM